MNGHTDRVEAVAGSSSVVPYSPHTEKKDREREKLATELPVGPY